MFDIQIFIINNINNKAFIQCKILSWESVPHTHMHVHIHTHMSIYKLYTMWFMHNLNRQQRWNLEDYETKIKHMLTPNMTRVRLREKVAAFSFISLPRPAVDKNGLADISFAALLIFGAWCCVQCSDQLINLNFLWMANSFSVTLFQMILPMF